MSESEIQTAIMLDLGRGMSRVFRNNCGVATFPNGSKVKYGVASPGGSDLIGWKSETITADMVGMMVAVFVAVEVKNPGGRIREDQEKFISVVRKAGGRAGIARSVEEARAIADGKK